MTRDLKIKELLLLTTKLGSEFQMGIMLIKKRTCGLEYVQKVYRACGNVGDEVRGGD